MNDQPEKAEDSDRTLNASDFEVSDISIKFGAFTVTLDCSVITLPLAFRAKELLEEHDHPSSENEEGIEIPAKEEPEARA